MKFLKTQIKNLNLLAVVLICSLSAPISSYAADTLGMNIPVYVKSQCDDDSVGSRMVYRTKEQIRLSSRMTVTNEYNDSIVKVSIICLTPDRGDQGVLSQYAYSISAFNPEGHYDYLITFGVGSCGSNRVNECAENRVASIDEAIDDLISKIRDGKFKYQK